MNVAEQVIGVDDLRNLIGEIRMMARGFLSSERAHSFTPTALAMTALRRAKLTEQDWSEVRWENRAHFFSALARAMRHALIDHARRRRSNGRANILYVPPDEHIFQDLTTAAEETPECFITLEEALVKLSAVDEGLAELIHQHYYLGYTLDEIALVLEVSEKTIDRNLKKARTLLRSLISRTASTQP